MVRSVMPEPLSVAGLKLKVAPGADIEPVRAVRERFPDVMLQVDANGAYSLRDEHVDVLRALD